MSDIATFLKPRALVPGDRVALVAASSRFDPEAVARGKRVLQEWGLTVEGPPLNEPLRYLAATDEARAAQLTEAFEREDIAAILSVRGGFGSARLFDLFDPEVAAVHPKMFVGYSDLTVLLSRLRAEADLVCFHGPMVASDLARLGADELERFRRFLFNESGWWSGEGLECRQGGTARGHLAGGCLSVLVTTLGTPYEIDTRGAVLFLEDIGEPPYRIDRMLTHLSHAGKLEGLAAVVLGSFLKCDDEENPGEVLAIFDEILGPLGIPVVAGFDAGHGSGGAVLPMGIEVRVDADAGVIELMEDVFVVPDETVTRGSQEQEDAAARGEGDGRDGAAADAPLGTRRP